MTSSCFGNKQDETCHLCVDQEKCSKYKQDWLKVLNKFAEPSPDCLKRMAAICELNYDAYLTWEDVAPVLEHKLKQAAEDIAKLQEAASLLEDTCSQGEHAGQQSG